MSPSPKRVLGRLRRCGLATATVVLSALLLVLSLRWNGGGRTNDTAAVAAARVYAPVVGSHTPDVHEPEGAATPSAAADPAPADIKQAYAALFSAEGGSAIDRFILQHLPEAEAGNADSALYVGDALRMCFLDTRMVQLMLTMLSPSGEDLTKRPDYRDIITKSVASRPEFYREETRRHMERAIACKRLGKDELTLKEEGFEWERTAADLGNPIALARSIEIETIHRLTDDPQGDANVQEFRPLIEDRLRTSKATILDALRGSRDLEVLLQAGDVISAATGRDRTLEHIAWALVACEYDDCEELNPLYRRACEAEGASYCSEEMSDSEYLMLKFPAQYDTARGRAMEIKEALQNENWAELGLQ